MDSFLVKEVVEGFGGLIDGDDGGRLTEVGRGAESLPKLEGRGGVKTSCRTKGDK